VVLSTYSKTPHYDPNSSSTLEPTIDVLESQLVHDVVGLIRCITVKVFYLCFAFPVFPNLILSDPGTFIGKAKCFAEEAAGE
jgi:hypothetical protein